MAVRSWGLAVLLCTAAAAHADPEPRRKVAVIDLSGSPAAQELRKALYRELLNHWALQPLDPPTLDAALEGAFLDEDRGELDKAADAKKAADDALSQFDYARAETSARDGLAALARVAPQRAVALYADLAFQLGEAELYLKRANDARLAFQLVHRLDPMRRADSVHFVTEIVSAYDAARAATPAKHQLEIAGHGEIWLDGIDAGAAPLSQAVEDGDHVVHAAGAAWVTAGQLVRVDRDMQVSVEPAPASQELQVRRARLALKNAPADSVARAGPMKHLAALLAVHDAVLITEGQGGALAVQTWRDRAPGFSAPREHGDEPAGDLLVPLAGKRPEPPPRTEPFKPPPPPIENEPAWYQKRWVQLSVAGGVAAVVVGAILWSRRDLHDPINPMTGWTP